MELQVEIYYDGVRVDPSELSSLVIVSPTVHRIVNRVIRRCEEALLAEEADQTTVRESRENAEDLDEPELRRGGAQ